MPSETPDLLDRLQAVNPAVGAQANLGSVIALTVSGGPPVTVPNPDFQVVPEPTTAVMLLALVAGAAGLRRFA